MEVGKVQYGDDVMASVGDDGAVSVAIGGPESRSAVVPDINQRVAVLCNNFATAPFSMRASWSEEFREALKGYEPPTLAEFLAATQSAEEARGRVFGPAIAKQWQDFYDMAIANWGLLDDH